MSLPKSIAVILSAVIAFYGTIFAIDGVSADPSPQKPDPSSNHALIIGINKYDFWPQLKSPVRDAEAIAKVLMEKYDFNKSNIVLLTDNTKEKPTLVNILTYLDKFSTELKEKDNLLIFFSGHSKEDDQGETYWIPTNGKKASKMTWISHAAIAEEVFTAEKFIAKNLCILSDSPFSSKLFRRKGSSPSPFDLRYQEKILEKATLRSREVIAFGDQPWPGSKKTDDLGLFTYYLRKALLENTLEVIDFENLIFEENIILPISKIAGTKIVGGRFKTTTDQGGQFVIKKLSPVPVIDVVGTEVNPKKGYPGNSFMIKAKTSAPAYEVLIDIDGQKHRMKGSGTDWTYSATMEKLGKTAFKVAAINERDIEGQSQQGAFTIIRRQEPVANVATLSVEPSRGVQGDNYRFSAVTDNPAKAVEIVIKGKRYKMNGSGIQWSLRKTIEDIGAIDFSIVATNEDGVTGSDKNGSVVVNAAAVNVVRVDASPQTGFAGEEFTITARTNRPAKTVSINLDGQVFPMVGFGEQWRFKKKIPDIGKKHFTVIAKNIEGDEGQSKSGELLAKKTPLPIPDVASVDVSVVSPGKGYAGDRYQFKVKTNAPSETVSVLIEGAMHAMQGSGTDWTYIAKIDKLGENKYQVMAKNKDGMQGESSDGVISTTRKPLELVNVTTAEVTPLKGYSGTEFTFRANTDRPAKAVSLIIDEKRFDMTGSDTSWNLTKQLDKIGKINFAVIARNADEKEGAIKTAEFTVEKELKGYAYIGAGKVKDRKTGKILDRFVDNRDGTVTDLLNSLMWLQQPKTIALSWDDAVQYCRSLDVKGQTGWRLPTIEEWKTFVDRKQKNPALPPGHPFTNVLTHMPYWSKTKHKFGPQYVYQMNLWYGKDGYIKKQENSIVWPVRYVDSPSKG